MALKIKNNGFTLLEILLSLGILGIIAVFAISLSHSTRNLSKINDSKNRMREINRAARDYYQGHGDLPAAAGSNEVPVAASALNLEQKHRLDGWGRYFYYDRSLHSVHTSRTDITGMTVDGKAVAGVIISSGPDQTLETANKNSPYATAGDDIVMAITVAEQAFAMAMNDLQVLQDKVRALDKIFAGMDNNSDGSVDESGCVQAIGCPQTGTLNDPNCSSATLDAITSSSSFCGKTVNAPNELIVYFYELGDTFLLDPWLQEYVWGGASSYGNSDPRFHKFFSSGPNRIAGDGDDLVP